MWNKISVWQYQQIYNTINNKDKELTELDVQVKLVGIIHNMTETQVDSLDREKFFELAKDISFLNEEIKGKPVKYIKVNNKRYRVIYDINKMPFARYIEAKVFSEDLYNNIHKLAATMVIPQKKTWFGMWVDNAYDASRHKEYSDDMLEANFIGVYHSLVFFYQVYRNWIEISADYLEKKMMEAGMEQDKAKEVVVNLCSILDGSIQPNLLPTTKILQLKKLMKKAQ